jgi:hypothetical protein
MESTMAAQKLVCLFDELGCSSRVAMTKVSKHWLQSVLGQQ